MSFKPIDVISATMDLSNSTIKTPEAESETPTRIQPVKLTPFTNGLLKRHALPHLHHPVVVSYKECRRNHAVELGGHAVDGCGEFMPMPSPVANTSDPSLLKCAACGCHRNFHRRELVNEIVPPTPALEYHSYHRHHPPPHPPQPPREDSEGSLNNSPSLIPPPSNLEYQSHHHNPSPPPPPPPKPREDSESSPNNSPSPSPPPISSSYAPHMLLALSHGSGQPGPDTNAPNSGTVINTESNPDHPMLSSGNSRKRFRTRFTQEQKGKMVELAERVGWRMQKRDGDLISKFCSEIGVEKGVFKVWMHNNKSNYGRKDNTIANATPPAAATVNGNSISYSGVGYPMHDQRNGGNKENLHDYGSSSC